MQRSVVQHLNHTVRKKLAVQMIQLMAKGACKKITARQFNRFSFAVQRTYRYI